MRPPREPEPVLGGDVDIAAVGALVADRARCCMLLALDDGRALPASRLAMEAGVTAATASSHLAKLTDAGFLAVEARGRHRWYRLAGPAVANLIEALEQLAPAGPVRSLHEATRASALRRARTCYDHLAGRLGVDLLAALVRRGHLAGAAGPVDLADAVPLGDEAPVPHLSLELTDSGDRHLVEFGVVAPLRRREVRCCVDWSERRLHLGGPLGHAILARALDLDWVRRTDLSRAVLVTPAGHAGFARVFGLDELALSTEASS